MEGRLVKNIVFESVSRELRCGAQSELLHDPDFVKFRRSNRYVQGRSNLFGDAALSDELQNFTLPRCERALIGTVCTAR